MATDLTNVAVSTGYVQLLHIDGGVGGSATRVYDGDGTGTPLEISTTEVVIKDGSFNLNVASHDGTNGLKLGGTLVTASAAEINYLDISSLGSAQSNKVLTTDSNLDVSGIRNLTATGTIQAANFTGTGNTQIGDAVADTVAMNATITTNLVFEGSTANAYETTLAITDPTADRTWTIPDATDTSVGRATTDTLTNKTLTAPDINTPDIDGGTVDAITSLTVANSVDIGNYTITANGFTADGIISFGTLTDSGESIAITKFVDEGDGISSNDNDTTVPTSAAVKDYVDTKVTGEDLDLTTDSGTIAIDLDSETLTLTGGTGVDTSASSNTVTFALDLNELTTETSIADADFIAMVDATDDGSGKITFENLEDAIFSSVSGDVLITEAGVATIQANSVALGTDTTGNYVATIADSGGGGITVSNSGSESAAVTLELDIKGLTDDAIASGDFIAFSDEGESGDPANRGQIDDVATLFAGTGLTASSSVISIDAAQTVINSLLATDIKIGEDDQTKIDFEDADKINFYAGNEKQLILEDGALYPGSNNIIDLGKSDNEFKNAFFDGTVTADAFAGPLTGAVTGNADTATLATTTTVTDSTANTNFPVVFHNESNGLLDDTGALRYNPSTGELLVPKLTVAGTTTTADTVTMEAANAIIFEGATADAHETTLSIVDPTADHTQYLINQGGYIPVLAAATTTAITSTPAELNILDDATVTTAELNLIDGGTARGTTAVASGDGILINDGGTMRMTNVDTVSTYFSSHNVGGGNIVTTGALNSGSITSGFGTIDTGSSTITTTGVVSAGGFTIGSAVIAEAELEMIDGITAGTAAASKAVVLDGSKNIATIGTIGSGAITATGSSSFATSIKTPLIEYTDGDDAITIADGGGITAANGITSTAASNSFGATAFSGAVTTNSTIDGIDIATRDGVLTSTTTTANAALPKAGGTMTGNIVMGDDTSIGIADDAERIEFDGAGDISVLGANLSVGTTAADGLLHVFVSDVGVTASADADELILENNASSADSGMSILTKNTRSGVIFFGDGDSATVGRIQYNHANDYMRFDAAGSERMRLDSNSRISLSNNDSGGTGGADSTSGNTIFGYLAGTNSEDGSHNNTLIGHKAAGAGTWANLENNVIIGTNAGAAATQADQCVIIGQNAGTAITGSEDLVLIGQGAGSSLTDNVDKVVFIGRNAGATTNNTGTTGSVGIGHSALTALTSGGRNTAIGFETLTTATELTHNVAIGWQTMKDSSATTSHRNIGIGSFVMDSIGANVAADNVAIGYNNLTNLTTGDGNTTIGSQSMVATNEGNNNTTLGFQAGDAITTGSANVFLGKAAGVAVNEGSNNIIIGESASASAVGVNDEIVIGQDATGQGTNTVTLGHTNITKVYAASDASAVVHCAGVNFPDDATGGDTDVNTLDAYEEGTFSPTMIQTGSSSISYTTQSGHYTKIGRNVTVQLELNVNSYTSGGTGNTITVGGFPFGNATARGTGSVSPTAGHTFDDGSDASVMTFELIGTTAYMSESTTGGRIDWGGDNLSTSGWRIFAGITYHAAT